MQHAAEPSYHVMLGDAKTQSGFLTYVVPVGFKYIADVMMGELQEAIAGGEKQSRSVYRRSSSTVCSAC